MRHAVVLGAVLLALPIVGQVDPLPPVTPRASAPEPVLVALAVEPIHEVPYISIEDAARANDYVTFNALFEQTQNPAYAPLHELWTYSINDPIGAFYGEDMYERFASRYPEFAAYIDEYKIVDDRGNVFYPTSETRAFLLARAIEGRTIAPQEPIRVASVKRRSGFSPTPSSTETPAPAPRVRFKKSEVTPAPVGLKPDLHLAPAAAPAPAPVVVAAKPVAPPQAKPVAPPPIVAASVVADVPKPDLAARGILLILIGLVGVGFLAMLLRAPKEPPPSAAGDLGKAPQ
ncbi:MAG TPA: hypothetical protein VND45_16305 [Thermoanaerobaculia bacterium]|jgi:hypothetical protein|nr:hypothetical protein [Thermoanaerobaculia bacterium]